MLRFSLIVVVFFFISEIGTAQHFLRTQGQAIVNENQDTILLRGMGLGGWMVQEGYMLQTAGFANPQHEIRETIENLIGKEDTDLFYEAWLNNHVRKADIDSLKSWGFNSVRLPMHYNLYTLPIEEEPVVGEDTWLERGFELTDSLINWCKSNEMYVILDMHATPGGQGYDAGISDYDSSKPSLWESAENRRKLTALWRRIAERYADEQWVAGYDLINEPNWDLPGGNALRTIYQNTTQAIREVDDRHMIIIEGNWFANDFTGLTPPWDDNMVYSPHKYWSINDQASIQYVLDLRAQHNVPLYLGESGENSNVWFRDAIKLFEDNNIGWAWWPLKKVEAIAGPLSVTKSSGYQSLLDYWNGNGTTPSAEFAKDALMQLTEDLKIENTFYQKDVIDAMFRQVQTDETKPFKKHTIPGVVNAVDYDLGRNGFAYSDVDNATYQVSTGNYTPWNSGWAYRNDGVDIEPTEDADNTSLHNVGYTNTDEWMQYEVEVEESAVYDIIVTASSGGSGGMFHFIMDGAGLTQKTFIGPTGGWQAWQDLIFENVYIDAGSKKLRFYTDVAGFNVSKFNFVKKDLAVEDLSYVFIDGETIDESNIRLSLNKSVDPSLPASPAGFEIYIDDQQVAISNVEVDENNDRIINIAVEALMVPSSKIQASYLGTEVLSFDQTSLVEFNLEDIRNTLTGIQEIPGKIEAEAFVFQQGISLETTTDTGGGENIGFLDPNDYLDYDVVITTGGTYKIDYRTAAQFGTGSIQLQLIDASGNMTVVDTPTFASTGDWQNWTTTSSTVSLPSGRYTMRMLIVQAPFNMNWMDFDLITSVNEDASSINNFELYPNPSHDSITIDASWNGKQNVVVRLLDLQGKNIRITSVNDTQEYSKILSVKELQAGMYILQLEFEDGTVVSERFLKE